MKKLGIIGGLGPLASAHFYSLITKMSKAETDQEHMEIILYSKPSIPDRTSFILGKSDANPLFDMLEVGRMLERMDAAMLAIPCITAHYFHEELERGINIPVLHAIRETAVYLKNAGVSKVGILATDGTVSSGLFEKILSEYGIDTVCPSHSGQSKVMDIIYRQVKTGRKGNLDDLNEVGRELFDNGAEVNLLGCTELSILKRDYELSAGYLDVMEVLARKAVLECGIFDYQYDKLITG